MIRLDAATVLLQWSVGGMAFCWFTTRQREVGLGYGWLLRSTYATLALASVLVGLRYGAVPTRELSTVGVVGSTIIALVVSIRRRAAGVRGQRSEHDRRSDRVAAMTGIDRPDRPPERVVGDVREFPPVLDAVPALIGSVGLLAAGWAAAPDGGVAVVVALLRTR
ncbi:MAG: hypothetical protein ACO3WU_09410, partial [Ilumatobacteraceae bacterium]